MLTVMVVAFAAGIVLPAIVNAQTIGNQITLILKKENINPVVLVSTNTIPTASTTVIVPALKEAAKPNTQKISRLDQLVAKLKLNTISNEVLELQTGLKKLGYFSVNFKPTKKYGPATAAAVKKYQADKKLPRFEQLVSRLRSGMVSNEVLELQTGLKKLGYLSKTFKPTNKYGSATAVAVKKYLADKKKKTNVSTAVKSPAIKTSVVAKSATVVKPATVPVVRSYTMAEVSVNNSAAKCWSAINGKVYNLTNFFGNHAGGDPAIASLCGKDGTVSFDAMHGGKVKPETVLKTFEIGLLK